MISSASEASGDPDPLSSGVCRLLSGVLLMKDDGLIALTLSEAAKDGSCVCVGVIVSGILLTTELNISGYDVAGLR